MTWGAIAAAMTVLMAGIGAILVLRWLAGTLNDETSSASERIPFAGGRSPSVHAWNRYHVRYYSMALLFLAFDMEMVFMYPWAVVFLEEGPIALIEMMMFIAILLLGILYAWRERALAWA